MVAKFEEKVAQEGTLEKEDGGQNFSHSHA